MFGFDLDYNWIDDHLLSCSFLGQVGDGKVAMTTQQQPQPERDNYVEGNRGKEERRKKRSNGRANGRERERERSEHRQNTHNVPLLDATTTLAAAKHYLVIVCVGAGVCVCVVCIYSFPIDVTLSSSLVSGRV